MRITLVKACVVAARAVHADPLAPRQLVEKFVALTAGQPALGDPALEDVTPPRFAFTHKVAAVSPKARGPALLDGDRRPLASPAERAVQWTMIAGSCWVITKCWLTPLFDVNCSIGVPSALA